MATFTAAAASSPPPPTSTQESSKILIHAKIIQTNGDRAANEQVELDVKSKNKQVSESKSSFMLATNFDISEIGDAMLNLSATHAIKEQHLVDTESELPLSQNNYFDSVYDKEELRDSASIIHVPQLLNEIDDVVLEPNTYAENRYLLLKKMN